MDLPSLSVIRTQGMVRRWMSSATYSMFCSTCQWMPRVAFSRASPPPVWMVRRVRVSVFFGSVPKWTLVRSLSSWLTAGQWQPSQESRAGRSVVAASGRW